MQGGEDASDALSCRALSAKEPRIIGPFCVKWNIEIRHLVQLRHPVFMHRDIRNGWVDIQSGWVDLRVCGWMAGCSCATKIERTRTGCMIEYWCRHSVHACMEFYTRMCGLYHDVWIVCRLVYYGFYHRIQAYAFDTCMHRITCMRRITWIHLCIEFYTCMHACM